MGSCLLTWHEPGARFQTHHHAASVSHRFTANDERLRVALQRHSVAYAISVWELATAYRELANASGQFLLLGLAVSAFYLAMSLPMAHLARRLETFE